MRLLTICLALLFYLPASVLGGDSRVYDREGKRVLTVHDHGKTSTVYDGKGQYLGRIKHGDGSGQDDRLYSRDGKYLGRVKTDNDDSE